MPLLLQKHNTNKKVTIAKHVRVLSRPLPQSLGLMFRLQHNAAFFFLFSYPVRYMIHMFFVFFPIDIIFLDKQYKVIERKENLKPFSCYKPKQSYTGFIELPAKTIKKYSISLTDTIQITEE